MKRLLSLILPLLVDACPCASVYHVHVKKQSDFRRVFTSSLKQAVGGGPTSSEGERKNSATLIGIGSLPLLSGVDPMTPGCLLPDSVYSLVIRPAFQLSVTVRGQDLAQPCTTPIARGSWPSYAVECMRGCR
jgi:hypothetical protein